MSERADYSERDKQHYIFDKQAASLGIPREQWSHPTVRQFVELVNRVANLQADLSIADVTNSDLWMESEDATDVDRTHHEEAAVLDPPLSERYMRAEVLMRVALDILREGFKGRSAHPDYIRNKLNVALDGYGIAATRAPAEPTTPQQVRRLPWA